MCGSRKLSKTRTIGIFLLAAVGGGTALGVAAYSRVAPVRGHQIPGLNEEARSAIAKLRLPASDYSVRSSSEANTIGSSRGGEMWGKPTNSFELVTRVNFNSSDEGKGIWDVKGIVGAQGFSSFRYQWKIPVGARIVNGAAEGSVSGLAIGEKREIALTIQLAENNLDPKVILTVSTEENGIRFGNGAVALLKLPDPSEEEKLRIIDDEGNLKPAFAVNGGQGEQHTDGESSVGPNSANGRARGSLGNERSKGLQLPGSEAAGRMSTLSAKPRRVHIHQ